MCIFATLVANSGPFVAEQPDSQGNSVPCIFKGAPLVALAPNLASMVDNLGAGPLLKGVASKSYWEAAHPAEDVGPFNDPDIEKILSLKPTLVLMIKEGTPKKLYDRLKKRNIAVFAFSINTMDDLKKGYLQLGCLLQEPKKAQELISTFEADLRAAVQKLKNKYPESMLLLSFKPMVAINAGTFTHDLFKELDIPLMSLPYKKKYPEVDREWFGSHKPKHIFRFCMGEISDKPKTFKGIPVKNLTNNVWIQPSFKVIDALKDL